jgi:uncharacterized protein (DUF58 family)
MKSSGRAETHERRIDPATLMRIRSLELRARHVVQGFWAGLNRSPYHGFSVEFTEYRPYVQGDDPRYLDWRLYARTDRYYLKRFEDETNLRCLLMVDYSRSMDYGSLGFSKLDYAKTLAATLGYFVLQQRDAVGLAPFTDSIEEYVPPAYRAGHLRRLLVQLERPPRKPVTQIARCLEDLGRRLMRRGMVILISDFLAPLDGLELALETLSQRGQEIVVFHLADPQELRFDFAAPELFEDLETGERVYVDPAWSRDDYCRQMDEHRRRLRLSCEGRGVSYHLLSLDTPLETALPDVLRLRTATGGGRRAKRRPA